MPIGGSTYGGLRLRQGRAPVITGTTRWSIAGAADAETPGDSTLYFGRWNMNARLLAGRSTTSRSGAVASRPRRSPCSPRSRRPYRASPGPNAARRGIGDLKSRQVAKVVHRVGMSDRVDHFWKGEVTRGRTVRGRPCQSVPPSSRISSLPASAQSPARRLQCPDRAATGRLPARVDDHPPASVGPPPEGAEPEPASALGGPGTGADTGTGATAGTGATTGAAGGGGTGTPPDPNAAGPLPLRRLTSREYLNTVRDLLATRLGRRGRRSWRGGRHQQQRVPVSPADVDQHGGLDQPSARGRGASKTVATRLSTIVPARPRTRPPRPVAPASSSRRSVSRRSGGR